MMKLIAFFLLAVVALASAGLLGEGPEVYSAVLTKQVHGPWSRSSSSRFQHFNHYIAAAPVHAAAVVAAPVHAAPIVAAPVHAASVVAAPVHAASVVAAPVHASAISYSSHGYGYGHGYYH